MNDAIFKVDGECHHILKKLCREILAHPKYEGFVRMYKTFDKRYINNMKSEYYLYLEQIRKVIPFPEWFLKKHYGQYHFDFLQRHGYTNDNINRVCVLTNFIKEWKTTDDRIVKSVHPPGRTVIEKCTDSTGNKISFETSAFVFPIGKNEKIIKQNN